MSYQKDQDTKLSKKFKKTIDDGGYVAVVDEEIEGLDTGLPKLNSDFQSVKKPPENKDEWITDIVILAEYIGVLSVDDTKKLQALLSDESFHSPAFYGGLIDGDQNSPQLKNAVQQFVSEYGGTFPEAGAPADIEKLQSQGLFKAGEWSVSVQMTGLDKSGSRHAMATGSIIVSDPQGNVQSFPFRSGGWGKYGDSSMLPGLSRDNMQAVSYDLDWSSYVVDGSGLPAGMKGADGTGSWLRLGTNPEQLAAAGLSKFADRGGEVGKDSGGFFGIHTDGSVPGSLGCIVMDDNVTDQLFEVFQGIPANQRPSEMNVLPPQDVIDRHMKVAVEANIDNTYTGG